MEDEPSSSFLRKGNVRLALQVVKSLGSSTDPRLEGFSLVGSQLKDLGQILAELIRSLLLRKTTIQKLEQHLLATLLLIGGWFQVLHGLQGLATQRVYVGATSRGGHLVAERQQLVGSPNLPSSILLGIFIIASENLVVSTSRVERSGGRHGATQGSYPEPVPFDRLRYQSQNTYRGVRPCGPGGLFLAMPRVAKWPEVHDSPASDWWQTWPIDIYIYIHVVHIYICTPKGPSGFVRCDHVRTTVRADPSRASPSETDPSAISRVNSKPQCLGNI